jgi:hypothetical protein
MSLVGQRPLYIYDDEVVGEGGLGAFLAFIHIMNTLFIKTFYLFFVFFL